MKIVKWVLAGVGALVLLAVLGAVTKFYLLSPKLRPAVEMKAPSTPEALARGKYLVHHVFGCVGCHSPVQADKPGEPPVEGKIGQGRDFGYYPDLFPGHVIGKNLTPDPDTGLGRWSDGEIMRAMREGVSRDGRPLFPMMPYTVYAQTMSDEDGLAVIAYLRSLPPIKNDPGQMKVDFPISMFVRAVPKPLESAPPPPPTDPAGRGKWLLKAGGCADCHTTTNERHEPLPGMDYAGNNPFPIPGKGTVYTANITSDKATGVGAYSDEDLMKAIFQGVGKSGRALYGMPWPYYAGLTDDDKKALILAVREIPPINNLVRPPEMK